MDLLNSFWSTHNVDQPWNMYNLPLPKFYIGIRYGGHDITHWANAELPHLKNVRTRMSKKWTEEASGLVRMNSRWGSRGSERTERYDDAHFDFYHPDVHFNVESGPRPLGQPGLILLQVIRVMCPNGNFNDAVTFGFSLPKGSPTQYQAIPIGDYD